MFAKQVRYLVAAGHRLTGLLVRCRLLRPTLAYVELHLTDRCNMNCKGCGHFSPIADPWYADPARRFGVQMPSDGFADIYAPGITGRRILDVLNRPAEACRFCTVALRHFSWARSKGERSQWEDLRCGAPRAENGHDTDYA